MKKTILAGAAILSLAVLGGCNTANNTQEAAANNMEVMADNMDAMAANTADPVAADALANQADATREAGEDKSDAIDAADVNAAGVNAM